MTFLRSLVFNFAYYLMTAIMVIASLPIFAFGSEAAGRRVVVTWARLGIFLLRVIAGTRVEFRGLGYLPKGGAIIAAKHQSMFETFALFPILHRPAFVMKQELARLPLWGWYATRAGMIPIERERGTATLRALAARVRTAIDQGRQVVIFPEGTRRAPGAEPDYKGGIAHLYRITGAEVVPVALNSGLFWPRRQFLRHPGTIVIEFLPPIPPGLSSRDFMNRLKNEIESASDRLLVEAADAAPTPPLPLTAETRLAELRGD